MIFYWSLIEWKSPQVSRNLSILVDVINTLIWIISILLLISSCFSPFSMLMGTDPSVPTITAITLTLVPQLFQFSGKVQVFVYLFCFLLFLLCGQQENGKVHYSAGSLFWTRLGDPFLSQNPRRFYRFHSPRLILGCAYTIWLYGQISLPCTVPSGSPSHPVMPGLLLLC